MADIAGVAHAKLRVGQRLQVAFSEHAHGEVLPQLLPPSTRSPKV